MKLSDAALFPRKGEREGNALPQKYFSALGGNTAFPPLPLPLSLLCLPMKMLLASWAWICGWDLKRLPDRWKNSVSHPFTTPFITPFTTPFTTLFTTPFTTPFITTPAISIMGDSSVYICDKKNEKCTMSDETI
ncbi:hypothetical protein Pcinc_044083 [Petrolisthes cinctipes]|uniref:Uncharacterized protein n=1 Tax=Petrolisthes cinctipes TaxID=88211 RepID=A0AAE1EFP9_PETCI|nr:hypothetical protein Pcinc_044083 [Petrolisthes cinctipes]